MHNSKQKLPSGPFILGISGSPVVNSNTDRLVRKTLESSALPWKMIKLSTMNIRPCRACLACVQDNVCSQEDDFQAISSLVKKAQGLVIGCYPPYGSVDAYTKAFLERLYSLRHIHGLNKGKLAVVLATGNSRGIKGVEDACAQVAHALSREGIKVLDTITAAGNPNCLVCGYGETCAWSAIPKIFPNGMPPGHKKFCNVEDQDQVWQKAHLLGQELGQLILGKLT